MKKCFKCKQLKPLDEFYVHKQMADGHLNKCKQCSKKDVRRRYYEPESRVRIKEYEKYRAQQSGRKSLALGYQRVRRNKYPDKNIARDRVCKVLASGRLVRQPCEMCGDVNSEAHHEDYSKALDVKWLCFKHHRETHGQIID